MNQSVIYLELSSENLIRCFVPNRRFLMLSNMPAIESPKKASSDSGQSISATVQPLRRFLNEVNLEDILRISLTPRFARFFGEHQRGFAALRAELESAVNTDSLLGPAQQKHTMSRVREVLLAPSAERKADLTRDFVTYLNTCRG